jgi:hypothetical protein
VENLWVEAEFGVMWYLFGRRAEERGACRLVDKALSFRSFRADFEQGLFLVQTGLWSPSFAARVSSDNPRLKAFCRVAPSVLLKVRAMFAARVLLFASFFKVRTSFAVQVRLRLFILRLLDEKNEGLYFLLL